MNKFATHGTAPLSVTSADGAGVGHAEIFFQQGVELLCADLRNEAAECFCRVLAIDRNHDGAWSATGIIRLLDGDFQAARVALSEALRINQDNFPALLNMGILLQKTDNLGDALHYYEQAVRVSPTSHEALNNLGSLYSDLGKYDQAMTCFRMALAIRPDYPAACFNYGNVCKAQRNLREALAWYDRALALQPSYYDAQVNRSNVLKDLGRIDEALQGYRTAIAMDMGNPLAHSNLLFAMHNSPSCSPDQIFREHQAWGRRFATTSRPDTIRQRFAGHCTPCRLRIGYVSPDFRTHSVACFIEPVLAAHDRARFEVFCYDILGRPDDVTARLRGYGWQWRTLAGLADEDAVASIRADGIDILVDLAGHTAGNRILLFNRRPAPVQVTWLGYPNTTGLPAIDYRLSDTTADPPGMTEHLHTEQLIRLTGPFLCFRPSPDAPPVTPLPADERGCITFISLNNFAKISHEIIAVWAQILQKVPASKLLVKSNEEVDAQVRRSVTDLFERCGIGGDRIIVSGMTSAVHNHLERYNQADVGLDTFPYNGATTTCEALWMGVPVVSLAGRSHVSRVGASILSHVGMADLIAQTTEEYVEKAVALATDLQRLGSLREGLRQQLQSSPLLDAQGFTRSLEAAFRSMWDSRAED